MFVVKLHNGFYSSFREDNLIMSTSFAEDVTEGSDELRFDYLSSDSDYRYGEISTVECDVAFIPRLPNDIPKEQAIKITDEVIRQIITKENKVIDIKKIFNDGYEIIKRTGKYECKLPNLKRKENESIIFKIEDGLFVFAQPENLNISESIEDTSVLEIAKCERYTGKEKSPVYRSLAFISIPNYEALDRAANRIAEAIADNQRLIDIPKIIDEIIAPG